MTRRLEWETGAISQGGLGRVVCTIGEGGEEIGKQQQQKNSTVIKENISKWVGKERPGTRDGNTEDRWIQFGRVLSQSETGKKKKDNQRRGQDPRKPKQVLRFLQAKLKNRLTSSSS
jgi:hypothetical protein